MQNIKHSVIVPCYIPRPEKVIMTQKCIELAKSKTKVPFQLIVAETCSNYFIDQCDIHIYEKDRTCTATSFNRAIRLADGEYVTILNNDVFVSDNWMECLEDCFRIEDCGIATLGSNEAKSIKQDKIEEALWFALTMIPKSLYEKLGYFDSSYRNGSFDDTDFVMKAVLAGKKCYRNLNCIVEHLVHRTHQHLEAHNENYAYNRQLFNSRYEDLAMTPHQRNFFEFVR